MTTTTTAKKKTLTIIMSETVPVKIDPDQWAVIASVETWNGEHKCQANHLRTIKVREHTDGRRLVYGVLESGNGGVPIGWRGASAGFLFDADAESTDIIRAIRRVAGVIGDDRLGDECIAELPAVEL